MTKVMHRTFLKKGNPSSHKQAKKGNLILPFEKIDFATINSLAHHFAKHIENHFGQIANVLLEYESFEVVVDETGKVISAVATSGPAMLRDVAVQAALRARFSPTKLSGQPVKVAGLINYKFALSQ